MFITRKRFEQELRRAEAKGRREQRREMEAENSMNAINADMWNSYNNLARDCDLIQNRLGRIEGYLDMCSDEKAN